VLIDNAVTVLLQVTFRSSHVLSFALTPRWR